MLKVVRLIQQDMNRKLTENTFVFRVPLYKNDVSNPKCSVGIQNTQSTDYVTLRRVRVTILWRKELSITYSECVSVALFIQHAMRHIIFIFVASLVLPYFSTLSHRRENFRGREGGGILNLKCVFFIFSTTLRSYDRAS